MMNNSGFPAGCAANMNNNATPSMDNMFLQQQQQQQMMMNQMMQTQMMSGMAPQNMMVNSGMMPNQMMMAGSFQGTGNQYSGSSGMMMNNMGAFPQSNMGSFMQPNMGAMQGHMNQPWMGCGQSMQAGQSMMSGQPMQANQSFQSDQSMQAGQSFQTSQPMQEGQSMQAGQSFQAGQSMITGFTMQSDQPMQAGQSFQSNQAMQAAGFNSAVTQIINPPPSYQAQQTLTQSLSNVMPQTSTLNPNPSQTEISQRKPLKSILKKPQQTSNLVAVTESGKPESKIVSKPLSVTTLSSQVSNTQTTTTDRSITTPRSTSNDLLTTSKDLGDLISSVAREINEVVKAAAASKPTVAKVTEKKHVVSQSTSKSLVPEKTDVGQTIPTRVSSVRNEPPVKRKGDFSPGNTVEKIPRLTSTDNNTVNIQFVIFQTFLLA